jgi:hypothetical protein
MVNRKNRPWAWQDAAMRPGPALLVLAVTLSGATAVAHVAPSVDDNNRYIKLTPAADRVRVAYTVFFGEVPGAQTRPSIDTNRDGQISEAEGQAFGVKLAAEVGASLELTVDGKTQPVTWSTVAVGMGSPQVAAGSFSIDMIAWACLPSVRGKHTLLLRDRFRVPRPGETEVKVEDGPGITIQHTHVGTAADPGHDYRFAGPGGPLTDDGLDLAFAASDTAPLTSDGTCSGAHAGKRGVSRPLVMIVVLALMGIIGGAVVIVKKRRPQSLRK